MDEEHMKKIDSSPSNLALMLKAGVKPSDMQYKQMVLAPVLMADASGRPINQPIKRSYSEGLDLASYWTQQQGARRGTVMKVQEVQEPGTFTKRMIQTTMGMVVVGEDCGTNRGLAMNIGDKNVHDRRLSTDVNIKGASFSAGTLLTPQVVDRIKAADKGATVVVRTPLKCEHPKGLCRHCAGLRPNGAEYDIGTNVGVIASQALGERSVQLTMKAFHSGGVVQSAGAARAVNDFERVKQLTDLTESIPNSATLAMRSGKIDKVEKDPTGVMIWIGGVKHHVGKDRSGAPLHESLPFAGKLDEYKPWRPPKEGMKVRAGEVLSDPNRTSINPRDLYRATNDMETVQNFLVDELGGIYGDDVRRQHVETVVRAMGDLTKVRDPGDAPGLLRGEFQSAAAVRAMNRDLIRQGKRPVEHSPVLKGVDNMPLSVQEDWMAKLQHIKLKSTLLDAAALGARSNLHGIHPVPGAAYGAEFGLTSRESTKPDYKHLKDVPRYAY
jgi:DNA-directed RNA polymerase subunit beta'